MPHCCFAFSWPAVANASMFAFVGVLCCHPKFRTRVQNWLGQQSQASAAAAGIGELLESKPVDEVLAKSQQSFRYVSCDKLLEEDMKDNTPNPLLRQLTEEATLYDVDAFLSHSWHDDPAWKWEALQRWRSTFKARYS